jgi:cyclopropane-fatty-acyl-phospholipid synthase
MLQCICERAGIEDGMRILDVGAGWGALASWIAQRYPRCSLTLVNRSHAQGQFVLNRGGSPLVLVGDARTIEPNAAFDRVVAIEMIEHTGNPEAMLARMKSWLAPGGRIFIQSIAHREHAAAHTLPWFERGTMLSDPLLDSFDTGLATIGRWTIDGGHYRRTLEAWRGRLEAGRAGATAALGSPRRYLRWRAFFIACEEMFGWDEGRAWRVVQRLYG